MNITQKFKATGYVLGHHWGGGESLYPSEVIEANTKEELLRKANTMLNEGSLDSGMGYQSLIGAILDVRSIKTMEIEGEIFKSVTREEIEFIGDVSEEQRNFMLEYV